MPAPPIAAATLMPSSSVTSSPRRLNPTRGSAAPAGAGIALRATARILRTSGKLEACGPLEIRTINRRHVPFVKAATLRVEIDPYAMRDRSQPGKQVGSSQTDAA